MNFILFLLVVYVSAQSGPVAPPAKNLKVEIQTNCDQLGYPVLKFTWETNDQELLSYYNGVLELSTSELNPECEEAYYIVNIDQDQTNLEIRAMENNTYPLFYCTYTFTLVSNPGGENTSVNFYTQLPVEDPKLQYSCDAVFNASSLSYTLSFQWSFQDIDCLLNAAIDSFHITLYSEGLNETRYITPHDITSTKGYLLTLRNQNILYNSVYRFELITISNGNISYYTNLSSVVVPFCIVLAPPVPPHPVTHVQVVRYEVINDVTATLSAIWSSPNITNGEIHDYQVWVGTGDGLQPQDYTMFTVTVPGNHSYVDVNFPLNTTDALYLQIRSTNQHCRNPLITKPCFSNWSNPIILKPTVCYPFSHNLSVPYTSEHDALVHARCFASCVDEFALDMVTEMKTIWPSITTENLKCSTKNKISLCYDGCVEKGTFPSQKTYVCTDNCITKCKSSCNGKLSCSTGEKRCQRKCISGICRKGCRLYDKTTNVNSGKIPVAPQGYPKLTPTTSFDGGEFNVRLAHNNGKRQESDHTFLIKVQTKEGQVLYLWQPTLTTLNVTSFNCQPITVSIAVVTGEGGRSSYSDGIELFSYGETRFADHPLVSSVVLDVKEDFRRRYFKHAIFNISWKQPTIGLDHLKYYEVLLFPLSKSCGGSFRRPYSYHVEKNTTNLIIKSERRRHPPIFGCSYYFKIYSRPSDPRKEPTFFLRNILQVSGNPPKANFTCARAQESSTGVVFGFAAWSVPCDVHLLETIKSFVVWKQFISSNGPQQNPHLTYIKPLLNQSYYTHSFFFTPRTDQYDILQLKLTSQRNRTLSWRLTPEEVYCNISSRSLPPTVIQNLTVQEHEVSDDYFNLTVTWSRPLKTYGNIVKYTIVISETPLLPHQQTHHGLSNTVNTGEVARIARINTYSPDFKCFYVQIKAFNSYNASNWSDPIVISKPLAQCLSISTPSTSPSPSPSPSMSSLSLSSSSMPSLSVLSSSSLTTPVLTSLPVQASNVQDILTIGLPPLVLVIVLVIIILLLIVAVFVLYRRKKRLQKAFQGPLYQEWMMGNIKEQNKVQHENPYGSFIDEWELQPDIIVKDDMISEGVFGQVYHGHVRGPLQNNKLTSQFRNAVTLSVAIKMLKGSATGSERHDFIEEIELMKKISEGNNPHIVQFIGCVTRKEPLQLIMVLIQYGDLLRYLEYIRNKLHQNDKLKDNGDGYTQILPDDDSRYYNLGEFTPSDLLSFAYQIASGMEYLADLGIIHRDLASRNVLIDEGKTLKISDFGMSRMIEADDVYVKRSRGRLPWKWMAIESLANREFSSGSDIWSFAVTLWEISTLGGFPYPSVPNTDMLEHLKNGGRLEKPDNCSDVIYNIMLECWNENPKERPTFTELRAKFDGLISAENEAPYIELSVDFRQPYYNIYDDDLFANFSDDDEDVEITIEMNKQIVSCYGDDTQPVHNYDRLEELVEQAEDKETEATF